MFRDRWPPSWLGACSPLCSSRCSLYPLSITWSSGERRRDDRRCAEVPADLRRRHRYLVGICCKPPAVVLVGNTVMQNRPALFVGRHFEDVIIILCVRWYLRYSLSYRDLEEMMAERGLSVDHVTI